MASLIDRIGDLIGTIKGVTATLDGRITTLENSSGSGGGGSLTVTKMPIYEYREIWAEESAALAGSQTEWSYGNGATGYIGIPHDGKTGWEVFAMYYQSDVFASGTTVTVDCRQYTTGGNTTTHDVCSITLNGETDGGGITNHAHKYEEFDTPFTLPFETSSAPIGFRTRILTGSASDARVGIRMRRQVGEYISDVSIA